MTDFNYLVHGSVIFAVGLFVGLIGALISTLGSRKEIKRLRKQVTELENRSHTAAAPIAAAAPVATEAAGATVAAKDARDDIVDASADAAATQSSKLAEDPGADDIAAKADDFDHTDFDHTKVKIATPKTESSVDDSRFNPPNLGSDATGNDAKAPQPAAPAQPKAPPVRPAADVDADSPRIVLDEPRERSRAATVNVVVPPRHNEPMPIPKLAPAAASLAAGASTRNDRPSLNLHVDRDNDVHGRIEPSLGVPGQPKATSEQESQNHQLRDADSGNSAQSTPEQTIWDSHDEVAPADSASQNEDLPPINDDGTVGFQTPPDSSAPVSEEVGDEAMDEESKKRSLRKALLTGGTLMGVDND